jgi:hypothetical protein
MGFCSAATTLFLLRKRRAAKAGLRKSPQHIKVSEFFEATGTADNAHD